MLLIDLELNENVILNEKSPLYRIVHITTSTSEASYGRVRSITLAKLGAKCKVDTRCKLVHIFDFQVEDIKWHANVISVSTKNEEPKLNKRSTTIDRVQARKDGETMSTKELAEKYSVSTAYAYKLRTGRA